MKSDDNMQFMLDIMSTYHQIIQQKPKKHISSTFEDFQKNREFEQSNQNI